MGATLVLPEPDDRVRKNIVIARLTTNDLASFWSIFKYLDKDKTGLVHLSEICKRIEAPRTLYSDSLLDLLDIDGEDGRVNFGEFLDIIITYCLFEPFQILKFCYFVFDMDKDGYFTPDELKLLMTCLHNIKSNEKITGTLKESWMNLEIAYDNRIEFHELEKFNKQFPQLFEPAFQLQIKMMRAFMGQGWWEAKKRKLQDIKDAKKAKEERKKAKIENRRQRVRANKLRQKMGCLYYYSCPCLRAFYIPELTLEEEQAEEDAKKKRAEEIAAKQRQTDADIKNQETAEWKKYEKKINPEKGGTKEYIEEKIEKIQRKRVDRAVTRKERKQHRSKMIDDGFDKKIKLDEE